MDQFEAQQHHDHGPLERDPGRADDLGVRVDFLPGQHPGGPARELDSPAQSRAPGRQSGPRPRGRRCEPRLRADRLGLRRRVHGVRPHPANAAQQLCHWLPTHVRHDRPDRQLPIGGRDRPGRRRRDLHHGLRLPNGRLRLRRLDRPADRPRLRPDRHGGGLHGARGALQADPWRSLLRACLVHRLGIGPLRDAQRHQVRDVREREL